MTLPTPTLAYFGHLWDSPIFDDVQLVQVDTPVGLPCAFCLYPIEAGDRGLLRSVVRDIGGQWTGILEPVHAECDLRMALGSPDHLADRCICDGYRNGQGHHTDKPFRQEALEVVEIENRRRATLGLPPMW